jgi:hypothetical protein
VDLTRVNDKQTCCRRIVINAAIEELSSTRLDKAKLILFMPMTWIGFGDCHSTSKLDACEIIESPVSY